MKKIDDKEIIDVIKQDTNYKIKTSSADILRKYRSEISEPVKEKHTKRNIFVFGGLGVTLVTAATLLAVVFSSKGEIGGEGGGSLLPDPTIKNSSFQEQLVLFSAFKGTNDEQSLKAFSAIKRTKNNKEEVEDDEEENKLTQETFIDICKTYHEISDSLNDLNKVTEFKGSDFNKEIKGKKYSFLNEIYYKGEKEPFAKMYFNDKELVTEEEGKNEYLALYEVNEEFYSLKIEKEVENDGDEKETEYKLKFKGLDSNHSYEIKKENEFEGVESESCYSFKDYSDGNFKNLIYGITYKSEKEDSEEKFEVQITKDKKEYLYENIIDEVDKVSFLAEVEVIDGDKLAEDVEVKGIKNNDQVTYTYKDFTYII